MAQIGCETCLKLQKLYSQALRIYADALQAHTNLIVQREHGQTAESQRAILEADELCTQHRVALQRHESDSHGKKQEAHT